MIVICLLFVVYFLKLYLFPCKVSNLSVFSHTLPQYILALTWVYLLSSSPLYIARGTAWT